MGRIVPHFRVVRPPGSKGQMQTLMGTRLFATFPEMDEIELTAIKGVELKFHVNGSDSIIIEFAGTIDMEIAHGNEEG